MPDRRSLSRLLWWAGVLCLAVLAVIGGLGLRGPGLVAIGVAGLLGAGIAVGMTRDVPGEDRSSLTEVAVQAGAWTAGILLALAGVSVLAGGVVGLLAGVTAALVWLGHRSARFLARPSGPAATTATGPWSSPAGVEALLLPLPPPDAGRPSTAAERTSRVSALPTPALGREWLRTSAALTGRLSPAERQATVRRRAETLDELESRDPVGFARWLASGPAPGSDPAAYVRGRSIEGDAAAGSDAA